MVTERLRGRGINNASDAMGEEKKGQREKCFHARFSKRLPSIHYEMHPLE